ncbi:GntR family transcriptional regulator [Labrys wisconsinensis]|uniref:GntR family transcriptional regulator n=1 Tax=Labrys wisconsinensis TaxID=425677 RepID=A0ABU0JHB0_9HYPH|nr:GntR family transcriptional regulator [Labrys wisconsinensis]MDQ0473659.1 GntR family transcriptional regulator [Labrys wisconsinensis]
MSLYKKTMSFILRYIEENRLQADDKLPIEVDLASMTGVSMVTVRRALAELSAQGIIRRVQGRGTFVAVPRLRAETTKVGSLRNGLALDARSALETRRLKLLGRAATAEEARRMQIADGALVWEISRLRLLDQIPMIHEVSVIPMILAPDLGVHLDRDDSASLYEILAARYGLSEAREEQTLVCRMQTSADEQILKLPPNHWVVEIAGVSYSAQQMPIDSFRMVFDARRFSFRLETVPSTGGLEAVQVPVES